MFSDGVAVTRMLPERLEGRRTGYRQIAVVNEHRMWQRAIRRDEPRIRQWRRQCGQRREATEQVWLVARHVTGYRGTEARANIDRRRREE